MRLTNGVEQVLVFRFEFYFFCDGSEGSNGREEFGGLFIVFIFLGTDFGPHLNSITNSI